MYTGAPGPNGNPNNNHIPKKIVQPINIATEYGSVRDITVPIPIVCPLFLYLSIIPNITGKYADKGEMRPVVESPIL